jgi:hypothetical protein
MVVAIGVTGYELFMVAISGGALASFQLQMPNKLRWNTS